MIPDPSAGVDWTLVFLLASLLFVNLAVVFLMLQAVRLRTSPPSFETQPGDESGDDPTAADGHTTADVPATSSQDGSVDVHGPHGTVTCPECDTHNEAEYRFCRQCIGELPGSTHSSLGVEKSRKRSLL